MKIKLKMVKMGKYKNKNWDHFLGSGGKKSREI